MTVGDMMARMSNLEYQRWIALRRLENEEAQDRALAARTQQRLKKGW